MLKTQVLKQLKYHLLCRAQSFLDFIVQCNKLLEALAASGRILELSPLPLSSVQTCPFKPERKETTALHFRNQLSMTQTEGVQLY